MLNCKCHDLVIFMFLGECDLVNFMFTYIERLPKRNVERDGRVGNGFDGAYITNTQDYR